jgi:hypothetical protein
METMFRRPVSYALSLAAGTALLALVTGGAGAMTLPTAAAQQALIVDSDMPKAENVYWYGPHWGHRWGWGWGHGWGGRGRWCYWHPRACG